MKTFNTPGPSAPATHVHLPLQVAQAVHDYLDMRPHREVRHLIDAMRAAEQGAEVTSTETAES